MKDEILKLPLPEGIERMESGPIQFGEDSHGYYLRGDRAFALIQGRDTVLRLMETGDTRFSTLLWASASLNAIPGMARCIVGGWDGLPPVSLWEPIETAPRDGTEILVWATSKNTPTDWGYITAFWWEDCWAASGPFYGVEGGFDMRCWMPLPTSPEAKS